MSLIAKLDVFDQIVLFFTEVRLCQVKTHDKTLSFFMSIITKCVLEKLLKYSKMNKKCFGLQLERKRYLYRKQKIPEKQEQHCTRKTQRASESIRFDMNLNIFKLFEVPEYTDPS